VTRRVLLVEDDADIALSLKHNLEREGGFDVTVAPDGERALQAVAARPPDLIVLDLNLPGMDGLEICRRLRRSEATASIPIVMVTARIAEADKISGLDLGADDYITKPFSVKEVLARVRAVLRRTDRTEGEGETLADPPVLVDLASRRVLVAGTEVALTRKEFDLLADLLRSRGRVLTRERLLERVWGYTYPGETRTVDVHIRRLRKKLGAVADERIETVVGVGYRWRAGA
jgi:DNA-binding response OmpR family regulator